MPVWKLEDGIRLGRILKPNGYLGFVKVAFFISGLEDYLDSGDFIFIEWMEKPVPYLIEEISWDDDKTARIKLADVNSDAEAKTLIDRQVVLSEKTIPASLLEASEDIDLIGFKVTDTHKKFIGTITGIDERGPQSLLELEKDGKEILIPVHEDIILKIDIRKRQVIVDLPEGLLEL
jgi:16S rRNA processing protein RimM